VKDRISLHVSVLATWVVGVMHVFDFTGPLSNVVFAGILGDAIDWVTDQVPWPPFDLFAILQNVLEWIMNVLITGLLDAIGYFFIIGLEYFLFYENPRNIDALNEYWMDSLVLYVFIVFVMMFAYYVMLMLLADTEEADIQRIVQRLIVSAIFLVISRELFGFFVAFTNIFALGILPEDYSFYIAVDLLEAIVSGGGVTIVALCLAIFGGVSVLVSGAIFFVALAMRMLIIYVIYAMMPVILGLWVVDVGPGKYGKFFADFLIKIAVVMMILGIIIAGMLAVGAAFGLSEDQTDIEMASDYQGGDSGTTILSTDPDGPRTTLSTDAGRGGELDSESSNVLFRMFMFIATIWVIIATITSLFGMVLSAGSASAGGAGGFTGSQRGRGRAGGGGGGAATGAAGGGAGGAWAAQNQGTTRGSMHAYEMQDGRQVLANPAGGGVAVNPDQGEWDSFGPEDNPLASEDAAPNPFNTTPATSDPTTLGDKASHIGDKGRDTFDGVADYVGGEGTGESIRQTTDEALDSIEHGAAAAAGKIPGSGLASKAANVAKRGGKAYGSVFMTDGAMASIGEMGRIARESPIGHPDKQQPWNQGGDGASGESAVQENGPEFATGAEAFNIGDNVADGDTVNAESDASVGGGDGSGGDTGTYSGDVERTGESEAPEDALHGSAGKDADQSENEGVEERKAEDTSMSSDEMAEELDGPDDELMEKYGYGPTGSESDASVEDDFEVNATAGVSSNIDESQSGDVVTETGTLNDHEYNAAGAGIELEEDWVQSPLDGAAAQEVGGVDEYTEAVQNASVDEKADVMKHEFGDDIEVTSRARVRAEDNDTVGALEVVDRTSDQRFTSNGTTDISNNISGDSNKVTVKGAKYNQSVDSADKIALTDDTVVESASADANGEFKYGETVEHHSEAGMSDTAQSATEDVSVPESRDDVVVSTNGDVPEVSKKKVDAFIDKHKDELSEISNRSRLQDKIEKEMGLDGLDDQGVVYAVQDRYIETQGQSGIQGADSSKYSWDDTVEHHSGAGVDAETAQGPSEEWDGDIDGVGEVADASDVTDLQAAMDPTGEFSSKEFSILSDAEQEKFMNQLEEKYGAEAVESIQRSVELRKDEVSGGLSELQEYANRANNEELPVRDKQSAVSLTGPMGEDMVTEEEVAAFKEMQELSQEFLRENYANADGKVEMYRGLGSRDADIVRQTFDDPTADGYEWPDEHRSKGYTLDREVAEFHNSGGGIVTEQVPVEDVDLAMDHVSGNSDSALTGEQEVLAKTDSQINGEGVEMRGIYPVKDGSGGVTASDEVSGPAQETVQKIDSGELSAMSDEEHETIMAGISTMRQNMEGGLSTQEGVNRVEKWKRHAKENFPEDYDYVVEDANQVIDNSEFDPTL